MVKVWAIEEGEYSDYHVVGVFSTRENAELILSKYNASPYHHAEISEWDLDPAIEQLNAGLSRFYVQILRDGTVREVREDFGIEEWETINLDDSRAQDGCKGYRIYVFAKDEQHAIKIANEKRLQYIANGHWNEVPLTA
jgi:hypothetical protein